MKKIPMNRRSIVLLVAGAVLVILVTNRIGGKDTVTSVKPMTELSETVLKQDSPFDPSELAIPQNLNSENSIVLEVDAAAAVVRNLEKNVNLLTFHPHKVWPIASVTKLATAVVAKEKLGPDTQIIIDEESVATEGVSGSFSVGEIYTVSDLIKAMLIISSNDASVAVAKTYGYDEFMEEMKQLATRLGMKDTNFTDPSGLSFLNQSTVSDLEKLIDYIMENHPDLLAFTSKRQTSIYDIASNTSRILVNINQFAGEPNFIGGKTGFTDAAGGNLVAIFSSNHQKIMVIVLGTSDRFSETERLFTWYQRNFAF